MPKIYLQEISVGQLQFIYSPLWDQSAWGDYTSKPTDTALKVWQNIGYNLFDENNPCLDPWALEISETWNKTNFGTQTHYDYRFYTGQKFYYRMNGSHPESYDQSYYAVSMAACKNIFGVYPLKNLDVLSGKAISPLGPEYYNIYKKDDLATHLASYPE